MKKRVLILNCGTLASTDINMSLRYDDEFEIWGASTNKNHGIYIYKNYIDDMLICEYLPGEEVTIDCFTNKNGKLLYCNPRAADRILAGISISNDEKLKNKIRKERNINCFSSNNVEVLLDWKA